MGRSRIEVFGAVLCCICLSVSTTFLSAAELVTAGTVRVLEMEGLAEASTDGASWQPLATGDVLKEGVSVRTGKEGYVDFLVVDTGAYFRLTQKSQLRFAKVESVPVGEMPISTTRVSLSQGTIVGSQPKLINPSSFEIATAESLMKVSATEYVVRAYGAVSAIDGSVRVNYVEPRNGGATQVTLYPGQSFDPETRMVVDTSPEYLENLIAEVDTVKRNAEVYKVDGARVVVQPEPFMSPNQPLGTP